MREVVIVASVFVRPSAARGWGYQVELSEPACANGAARLVALATLPGDISGVFP